MRNTIVVLLGALLAAAGCGGPSEPGCPPTKEIATSSLVKNGDTWDVAITSNIEAPLDKVVEVASHPEKGHDLVPENLLKTEILKEEGSNKTVDIVARLDILPPGFKVQNIRTEYVYYPEEKRFTTKSIDFKLADITAEYKFAASADGKGTLVKMTQKSKDKSPLLLDSLQKSALCETFAIQMKVVRRGLGLDAAEKPAS